MIILVILLVYGHFPIWSPYIISYYSETYFDAEIGPTALSIAGNASNDTEKVIRIMEWQSKNMRNIWNKCKAFSMGNLCITLFPPNVCIRLVGHDNPSWILFSRCGACEEYALIFTELAKSLNITARSIHNHGEDHNWVEVFIDNRWIVVDPSINRFNVSPSMYDLKWANRSYVYALDDYGNQIDITKRYTGTGTLIVNVESEGNTTVFVHSNSVKHNNPTDLNCTVSGNGTCKFEIGGNDYTIVAVTGEGIIFSDQKNIILDEGSTTIIDLSPKYLDISRSVPTSFVNILTILLLWFLIGFIGWEINIIKTAHKAINN